MTAYRTAAGSRVTVEGRHSGIITIDWDRFEEGACVEARPEAELADKAEPMLHWSCACCESGNTRLFEEAGGRDMTCVDIEIDDYLFDASDFALKAEIKRRQGTRGWDGYDDPHGVHPWTKVGMAHDLRTAFYARDATRMELILAQLELRETA